MSSQHYDLRKKCKSKCDALKKLKTQHDHTWRLQVIYISYNQQANSQEMQIAHNEDLDKNEGKQQEKIIKENTQKRERKRESGGKF